jgi:hypothetical protein
MVFSLHFVGMSKNCFNNLKPNIEFLLKFQKITSFKMTISVVDSDSTDGTKEYCSKLYEENLISNFIEIDDLEDEYNSRIERLSISRNKGLQCVKTNSDLPVIYIPMDMDLDLFGLLSTIELESLIKSFAKNKEIDGLFPFSTPFYYDIFALRAKNWVKGNNILTARNLKDKVKVFSFIFNYFLIFNVQKNIDTFTEEYISVQSAFGGMGLYKITESNLEKIKYEINKTNIDYFSEHIAFNNYFKKLYISRDWNFPSPLEYIFFNTFTTTEKISYIFKTLKNDIKNLF